MILTKRQIEQLDFEPVEEDNEIEIYEKDEIEITFDGKQCIKIELDGFEIKGIKSIQALERFMVLVYCD